MVAAVASSAVASSAVAPASPGDFWRVVGGAASGGIIVRTAPQQVAAAAPARLATGSRVRLLRTAAEAPGAPPRRAEYELLEGSGPATGWVALAAGGRELLAREARAPHRGERARPYGAGLRVRGASLAQAFGGEVVSYSSFERKAPQRRGPGSFARGAATCAADLGPQEGCRCAHCGMPVGDEGYEQAAKHVAGRGALHAECATQVLVQELRSEDAARVHSDRAARRARRAAHGVGWRPELAPRGGRLAAEPAAGLQCLLLSEDGRSVRVAPTSDPGAAVRLEYLAVALEVRRREGREPMFSLDPVTRAERARAEARGDLGDGVGGRSDDDSASMWQTKRYEPEWLAGTSVGEVMFQADVHLKELSMGEHAQPILGMRNCLDYLDEGEGVGAGWSGREWFTVRAAAVGLGPDGALRPHAALAVEAREQLRDEATGELEDALLTRPDHPLVRYAGEFSRFAELIAERRSVIFHLRELARASVLAKFVMESAVDLGEAWFHEVDEAAAAGVPRLLPQLWNERRRFLVHVRGGDMLDTDQGVHTQTHGLYGGVKFGLDKFRLTGLAHRADFLGTPDEGIIPYTAAATTRMFRGVPAAALQGVSGPARLLGMDARLAAPQLGLAAAAGGVQGVDLGLERFNLSSPIKSHDHPAAGAPALLGGAFWAALARPDADGAMRVYRGVFNPHLSDRRAEGDGFVPPVPAAGHTGRLERLLGEEAALRRRRLEAFLGRDFDRSCPGRLFPAAWAPSSAVASRAGPAAAPRVGSSLYDRPDYVDQLGPMLKGETPVFDRAAEDGMRFRVYEVGSLEVRTTQEHDGEEAVGAVFATRPAGGGGAAAAGAAESDIVARATQYVEMPRGLAAKASSLPASQFRYFVALETEVGRAILFERLQEGDTAWTEGAPHVERRTALARVMRYADCRAAALRVRDFRAWAEAPRAEATTPAAFAEAAVAHARAEASRHEAASQGPQAAPPELGAPWRRRWAGLSAEEQLAVAGLLLCPPSEARQAWESRSGGVWRLGWLQLTDAQRAAADALGLDRAAWTMLEH